MIQEEIQRRNLEGEVEQQILALRQQAEEKARVREIRRLSFRLAQCKFFIIQLTNRWILFSIALFALVIVLASFLQRKGFHVAIPIVILGLIELSVVILIESKNRLGRCLRGVAIKIFLIWFVLLLLCYSSGVLHVPKDITSALAVLTVLWIPSLLTYFSFFCEQQYDRQSGNQEMPIRCPNCNRTLEGATEKMVGHIGVCPKCKTEFEIRRQ